MTRTLIRNIGEFFTGDIAAPRLKVRALLVEDRLLAALDPPDQDALAKSCDVVIDARGAAVLPGLVDGHVHPVLGEWTPMQDCLGWIGNYVHGGTTSLVSAGEVHVPGLDYHNLSPEVATALAIVVAQSTGRVRWSGAKVHAGTLLLVPGMREEHFERAAKAGSRFAKFLFYPLQENRKEATQYVRWCRTRGMRVKVHTGGVSRSLGNAMCGYEVLSWLQPDIAAHVSGGPIPMPDADLEKTIQTTEFALEVCVSGSYGSTRFAVRKLADLGRLDRLTLGTDTPAGTGVIPRGLFREIMFLTSICDVAPEIAIAVATGNTARAHGLDVGILTVGRPADMVICGPVGGATGTTVSDAIAHGDLPGISHVLIDGDVVVAGRSRQTPPPATAPRFECCSVGWLHPNGFPREEA